MEFSVLTMQAMLYILNSDNIVTETSSIDALQVIKGPEPQEFGQHPFVCLVLAAWHWLAGILEGS